MDTTPPQDSEKPECPFEEEVKRVTLNDIGGFMTRFRTIAHCLLQDEENAWSRDTNDLLNAATLRLVQGEQRSWDNAKYFENTARCVMRHQLVDWGRARARRVRAKPIRDDIDAYATDAVLDGQLSEIRAAIKDVAKHRPAYMRAVEDFHIKGMECSEIAAKEGIEENGVQRRLRKGMFMLRCVLRDRSKDGDGK